MKQLPEPGFTRLAQIVRRRKKSEQGEPSLLPISASSWWAGVRSGRYPSPVKLGPGITCWKNSDLNRLLAEGVRT